MTVDETRAHWIAHYEATVTRLKGKLGPGVATPAQLEGKSGLQVMLAMLAGEIPYPMIGETLDFALVEVTKGSVVFQGTPQLKHFNPLGTVHGGWYATLLDSAVGCSVHTSLAVGQGYTTAELSVNIVRAANQTTGPLRAIGKVIHSGRQLATAEGRIVGPDGKLYAHATTTCLVFEPRAN
jgi:uncharacterized protein (TIGR00369 family)